MRYAIVGAGSVGCMIGARMVRAGHDVTFVDQWPEHVEAMKRDGLHVECSGEGFSAGERFTVPVTALHLHEVHRLQSTPIDAALVCVKSYDTAWSSLLIRDCLAPQGFAVSVQNSFNEPAIAEVLGWDRVLGCIVNTIGSELHGPGRVVRWAPPAAPGFPVFRVGEPHGRITPRARAVARALECVDPATVTTNLWGERWSKLAHNAMGSGLCVVLGIGLLEMYRNDDTRRISVRLVQEAVQVGHALGYELEPICGVEPALWLQGLSDPVAAARIDEALHRWTLRIREDGQTSSLHDLRRGRRMETDAINGLVLRKGIEAGVPVPHHARIVELTHRIERGERPTRAEVLAAMPPRA